MSRFQRMIIIPQEEYSQLLSVQKAMQPYTQPFQQLQKRFDDSAQINDPYSRLLHETDAMNQMRVLQGNMRDMLMTAVPKAYKSRAESLLKVIEPHVKVSPRGELVEPTTGKVLENTRVDDLIQHAVSGKRRAFEPSGWLPFVEQLRKINVPKSILNRETIQELETKVKTEPVEVKRGKKRRLSPERVKKRITQTRAAKENIRYPKEEYLRYY